MIIKTGIDIVNISRIDYMYKKYNIKFLDRILTQKEQEYCLHEGKLNIGRVAKRFAGKEAFSKCSGIGIGEISFLDIEILNDSFKAPYINLSDKISNYFKIQKKWYNISADISLSDDNNMAIASVLLQAKSME